MQFNKLRISADATSRLRSLRQRTGLTPNLLCRIGLAMSLEEGAVGGPAPDEAGQEFNAYTLVGEHAAVVAAMLRTVERDDGEPGDEELVRRLRAHIHRGVATLSVRVRTPAELARLMAGGAA